MLTQEDGTWLEVFDPRWSHCHEWSGCPTWQLSVYVLGLRRRFDIETNCFAYSAADTGIRDAEGAIPAEGGTVRAPLARREISFNFLGCRYHSDPWREADPHSRRRRADPFNRKSGGGLQ